MRYLTYLFLITLSTLHSGHFVRVPVADMFTGPLANDLETQSLLGDPVVLLEKQGDFVKVSIPDQFLSAPVWVQKDKLVESDFNLPTNLVTKQPWVNMYITVKLGNMGGYLVPVSLGTKLHGEKRKEGSWKISLPDGRTGFMPDEYVREIPSTLTTDEIRAGILETGLKLIGNPYFWGGASAYRSEELPGTPKTGVDCSGLAYLLYRSFGFNIPRNSKDQFTHATQVTKPKPADLVFYASKGSNNVSHVMLVVDNDTLLESPQTGDVIRLISATEKLGRPLDQINSGDNINGRTIYFATFLKD